MNELIREMWGGGRVERISKSKVFYKGWLISNYGKINY